MARAVDPGTGVGRSVHIRLALHEPTRGRVLELRRDRAAGGVAVSLFDADKIRAAKGLEFDVIAKPIQQGSHIPRKGKDGRCYCVPENPRELRDWRRDVADCAQRQLAGQPGFPRDAEIEVVLWFSLLRPASVPKRRLYPTVRPDWDKLARAVGDALTISGVIYDDAQIVHGDVWKRYARPGRPVGCKVIVRLAPEDMA